ncbi:hypothetical protein PENSPDRAFT_759589 [Peniophora sp. CONT]|nr:hypothetical protein PENSPDRAFT_759589 [Peniophora sp. CONT]
MNFPRYSNPHLHAEQVETVTRSDLLESDIETTAPADRTADVEELDALVKHALGEIVVSEPPRKKHKKKHAKVEEIVSSDQIVSFHLFSSAPVREYNLAPKPHPEINNEGPPCEDNEASAESRRAQAAAVAVDFDWVLREGLVTSPSRRQGKEMRVKTTLPDSPPPLAMLERPRSILPVRLQLKSSARPSPHETKVAATCPILEFTPVDPSQPTSATLTETARRRMRRQKKRSHEKADTHRGQAKFYRPLLSHGPVGYAMGYEGSWPVEDEDERKRARYVRDGMKVAEWAGSAS